MGLYLGNKFNALLGLRAHCAPENAGIPAGEFARRLRVSHVSLSRVVNGRAAVSAEPAIRLAAALDGSAESWLTLQLAYDLARAETKRRPHIERIPEAA
jgi:addiction module HigA family antidote